MGAWGKRFAVAAVADYGRLRRDGETVLPPQATLWLDACDSTAFWFRKIVD